MKIGCHRIQSIDVICQHWPFELITLHIMQLAAGHGKDG